MSRDGSIIFGDLIGKLDVPKVTCEKCGRAGRYGVARLIEQHGRDGKMTDWLADITADCPKKRSVDMSDQCGACCPGLLQVL